MIDISDYISRLMERLTDSFGARLLYVGLQGSYLRGEATDKSDIDIMVVIDELSVSDLKQYRAVIESMEHFDKSCGFICSRSDLSNWNPLEICHLLHSTRDYYGVLRDLVPDYTEADVRNFVKLSINNLYHELCHRYIHASPETNTENLPLNYKGVFFILQNLRYLETGDFVQSKRALLPLLSGSNYEVLKRSIEMSDGVSFDFQESFDLLFRWCGETMKSL